MPSDFSGPTHELLEISECRWMPKAYDYEQLLYKALLEKDDKAIDLLKETTHWYTKTLTRDLFKDNPILLKKRSFLERIAAFLSHRLIQNQNISFKTISFSTIPHTPLNLSADDFSSKLFELKNRLGGGEDLYISALAKFGRNISLRWE